MEWSEVIQDPTLGDLPFKIELNEHGTIMMTPASNRHGRLQIRIGKLLLDMADEGDAISECSVNTSQGVKVADVAWLSDAFLAHHGEATPYPAAPELCVEIVSPSNSRHEMEEKIELYLEQGAHEVWLCDEQGDIEFFAMSGAVDSSALFPDFPVSI